MTTEITWLLPLLLLPGVALLIMSTSIRYGQLHNEVHHLLDEMAEMQIVVASHLRQRAKWFRNALTSLYLSVALFVIGSMLGALMDAMQLPSQTAVAIASIGGIVCLIYASIELIRESRLSLEIVEIHLDMIVNETPHTHQ